MGIFKYCLITFLLNSFTLKAQVSQDWATRYNGTANGYDGANSIVVDYAGNIYITGSSEDSTSGSDFITIKYNPNGQQQWESRYNGTANGYDGGNSIAVDTLGNVYVTGQSSEINSSSDLTTIKYNSNGVEEWVMKYNGIGNSFDAGLKLVLDNLGNVYVTGHSSGGITSNADFITIKYNSAGVQQWTNRYNGSGNFSDRPHSITIDNSLNVYVTGYSPITEFNKDFLTIKYNSIGEEQWAKRYNGSGNGDDEARSIVVDLSGNVFITGESEGGATSDDFLTMKYNSLGQEQWTARYNGTGNESDVSEVIVLDRTGNIYVTGSSGGIGSGSDYVTIKYNQEGSQQWISRYNGVGNSKDEVRGLSIDANGNCYVTGFSYRSGVSSSADYTTIKYSTLGLLQWIATYNGLLDSSDICTAIAVDELGNVFVTGNSQGVGSFFDIATIKYSQTVNINQLSLNIPNDFILFQNYPNPFNPETKIGFSIPNKDNVRLFVYDITGKKVDALVDEVLSPGTYEVVFKSKNLESGVYFYRLETRNFTSTKKMILIQ